MARGKGSPQQPGKAKETAQQKKERRDSIKAAQQKVWTVVLPSFLAILALVFVIIYFKVQSVVPPPIADEQPQ